MDAKEFEDLVAEAIDDLPQDIRRHLDNVAVVVEDAPSVEQLNKGGTRSGGILLGLYEGIPKTKRGPGYTMVLPDKITIFRNSIMAVSQSPEQMHAQIKQTVWHEIAHHFGFSESGVQALARRRKQRLYGREK